MTELHKERAQDMKKFNITVVIAALVALTAATTSADMYPKTVTDVIDTWGLLGVDAAPIIEGAPLTYFHDLNQEIDFVTEYVTQATLALDFTNMGEDGYTEQVWVWTGFFQGHWEDGEYVTVPGWEEYVTLHYDEVNGTFVELGEIDPENEPVGGLVLNVDWLNDDGKLDVAISVWNYGILPASISLDKSTLTASVEAVPVPGAALLGVLGLSAAGMKLRRRKSA